jgi:hydrogenase nickel incorporation protein HypA/HybF
MHEASLAKNLLEQVCCIASEHPLSRIARVEIELGPLSGVEPLLLSLAFERLASESSLSEMELVMREVALLVCCQNCMCQSEIDNFEFICSQCGSTDLSIVAGDCIRLTSVDLKPLESCEGSKT